MTNFKDPTVTRCSGHRSIHHGQWQSSRSCRLLCPAHRAKLASRVICRERPLSWRHTIAAITSRDGHLKADSTGRRLVSLAIASMPDKRKKSKGVRRAPLTRTQLLPMKPTAACAVSLRNHLALVTMRAGRGNADLASELIKTLYLAYFVCDKERLEPPIATYVEAEAVLKICIQESEAADEWRIAEDRCGAIGAVLCAYDRQLSSAPLHRVEVATERLDRILRAGHFPDLRAMHGAC